MFGFEKRLSLLNTLKNSASTSTERSFSERELLADPEVQLVEGRLPGRVALEQERRRSTTGRSLLKPLLATPSPLVSVEDVGRVGDAAAGDERARRCGSRRRQLGRGGGLELVRDVEAVAPVVQLDVERILRAEEGVGVALARRVVLVLRPRVVDEELVAVREAPGQVDHHLVEVAPAGAAVGQGRARWCRSRGPPRMARPNWSSPSLDEVAVPLRAAEAAGAQEGSDFAYT